LLLIYLPFLAESTVQMKQEAVLSLHSPFPIFYISLTAVMKEL
jgi:hypothetical protein